MYTRPDHFLNPQGLYNENKNNWSAVPVKQRKPAVRLPRHQQHCHGVPILDSDQWPGMGDTESS